MTGVLRGFDQFMNIVLDETVDMGTQENVGMVVRSSRIDSHTDSCILRAKFVRFFFLFVTCRAASAPHGEHGLAQVIRGNSINLLEPQERV